MFSLKNGIAVARVAYQHKEIEPKPEFESGKEYPLSAHYLGGDWRFAEEGNIELWFEADKAAGVVAFEQDGRKNALAKRNLTPELGVSTFQKTVRVFASKNEMLVVSRHPQNFIRFLMPGTNGSWAMDEVAVVAQANRVFLTFQRLYYGRAFLAENGGIVDPSFARWVSLQKMLGEVAWQGNLSPVAEYAPRPPDVPEVKDGRGVVKFWNLAQGWGSVYVRENAEPAEARAHWAHVSAKGKFAFLRQGDVVSYDIASAKGLPDRPTQFRYELFNVLVI